MGGYFLGTRVFAIVLAALTALVIAAGCGGDESSDAAAAIKTGSLSKEEFIKKADDVCEQGQLRHVTKAKKYLDEHAKLKEGALTPEVATDLAEAVVQPVYRQEAKEIAELGAPESDATDVEELVAAIESDMDNLGANPAKLLRAAPILPAADKKAGAYGLTVCAAIWV